MINQLQYDELQAAISQAPEDASRREQLADFYFSSHQYTSAEKEYRRSLHFKPNQPIVKLKLIETFYRQLKISMGIVLMEELIKTGGDGADLHLLHARLHYAEGHFTDALYAYESALSADPHYIDPFLEAQLNLRLPEQLTTEIQNLEYFTSSKEYDKIYGYQQLKRDLGDWCTAGLEFQDLEHEEAVSYNRLALLLSPMPQQSYIIRAAAGFIGAGVYRWDCSPAKKGAAFPKGEFIKLLESQHTEPVVLHLLYVDMLQQVAQDLGELLQEFPNLLIIAETAAPWHLEKVVRSVRAFYAPYPDRSVRATVLRKALRGKPTYSIDDRVLAKASRGFTAQELKQLVSEVARKRHDLTMSSGTPHPIRTKDLLREMKGFSGQYPWWLAQALLYGRHQNDGGTYDELLRFFSKVAG